MQRATAHCTLVHPCSHAAASWGHGELLRYLLENGGDANIGDSDGDTPLHVCETYAPSPWLRPMLGLISSAGHSPNPALGSLWGTIAHGFDRHTRTLQRGDGSDPDRIWGEVGAAQQRRPNGMRLRGTRAWVIALPALKLLLHWRLSLVEAVLPAS